MTPLRQLALFAASGGQALNGWERAAIALVGAPVVVGVVYRILRVATRRLRDDRGRAVFLPPVLTHTKRAVQAFAVSIAGIESVRLAPASARAGLAELARVAVIVSITWIAAAVAGVAAELTKRRFDTTVADNRDAWRALTQLQVVRRVVIVVVVVIGGLAALTSLPEVRTVGASLLASAGVLGIVAGIAGQSTLGNVIAGLQLAFSDALRLDDVVVVQGQWGRIEQITLTYVVVKTWDERRLVLPVSYFVATPFENWTRTDTQLLGTVYLYVDYTVPVDEVRTELLRFVATHPLWDGRSTTLQVVDTTEATIQLRIVVSAATSGDAWDLRCAVRVHLVEYVRDRHPGALPRLRLTVPPAAMESRPGDPVG